MKEETAKEITKAWEEIGKAKETARVLEILTDEIKNINTLAEVYLLKSLHKKIRQNK